MSTAPNRNIIITLHACVLFHPRKSGCGYCRASRRKAIIAMDGVAWLPYLGYALARDEPALLSGPHGVLGTSLLVLVRYPSHQ